MKNKLLPLLFATLVLLDYGQTKAQQWAPVGSVAFSAGQANLTSIAIGKNDTPYLAYLDLAHNDAVSVMKYNGSAWVYVGSPGFSNPVAVYSNNENSLLLKIDKNGKPYVLYEDSLTPPFSIMSFDGSSWNFIAAGSLASVVTNNQADVLDMAIDSSGTPYVAFVDGNQSYKASVIKYSGGAWAYVGPQNFTPGSSDFLSLAIDHSGTPWLAFSDGSVNGRTSVQKFNGSNWILQGQQGFSGGYYGVDHGISLTFDNNDIPYIAYGHADDNDQAYVKEFVGNAWIAVGDTDFSGDAAIYLNLCFTSGNVPVLSFSDKNNNYKATVKYFNGATWTDLGTPDFSSGEADWVSLAVTKHGVPYVGFVDYNDGHAASVFSFGIPASINEVSAAASVSVYPNPCTGTFNVKIQSPAADALSLSIYDIVGQMVWSTEPVKVSGNYSTSINLGDMAKGTYFLQVKSGAGVSIQKVELIR